MQRQPSAAVLLLLFVAVWRTVNGDPQANLLGQGCSLYKVSSPSLFFDNLNATFANLRSNLSASASGSSRFATAQQTSVSNPVYALFQCRDYLSTADCVSCLAAAELLIRNCSTANGGRVILDGCFLRYESSPFFDQTTQQGNRGLCSNGTAAAGGAFSAAAEELLLDLSTAVPRIENYFAAAEQGGVYGVAQCVRTVSESGCGDCLRGAYGNIKGCPPDAEGRAVDAGCFMRYSDKAFFPANQTVDLAPYLKSGRSSKKGAIIGGIAGGVGFLLLLAIAAFLWIRRSRKPGNIERGDILGATELRGPVDYRYADLKAATKDFSEENKLGEGGFGEVYKGILKNGKAVAVKKLTIANARKVRIDFQSEVKLISNVHHRNLVRLLGCSTKGPELLLVYEYMANSSLDKVLYGDKRGILNWKQRFDIIVGIARGLAYLHQEFHVCIIHRDIKSSNVLLDDNFQPKIADFGLARLLPGDHSHLSTNFAGTLGYTAPEYAIHGQLSEKVDTYSYGVVVLEIISGRKSNDVNLEPVTQYLLEWAWKLYETETLLELVDASLDPNEYRPEEVKRVIEIALMCTQSTVAARPTMSEVVVMLLSKGGLVLQPTRPVFIDATSRVHGDASSASKSSSSSNAAYSNATYSTSVPSAR
ncbi:cysteine-rich receptor-like protein kinase 2 [Elaeis guineensis]|uniref:Cold-responsive protein kinase 1 n=1 Tax=Elaeis guineensis var. tenera TaxID=51953 RepID=A0A6I9SAB9_ELAGV|nr:cold-responsive protein kinase 1 [Elaeis guineensis]